MAEVIPEGERGNARVTHFEVSEDDARSYNIRTAMSGNGIAQVSPGRYARLTVGRTVVMSDTPMEQRTNRRVVQEARGDVLVAGLGIGMVLLPILEKEEVTSATVVEVDEDVVALVSPHLPQEKLRVVSADILEWSPPPGEKFDASGHLPPRLFV
jgi:spermidine synthase